VVQAYSNLKIHRLLRDRAHLIVKAETVFPDLVGGENKVALSLLFAFEDDAVARADDAVVDVEGASYLYLRSKKSATSIRGVPNSVKEDWSSTLLSKGRRTYSEVEGYLSSLLFRLREEALLLVSREFIGESGRGDIAGEQCQQTREKEGELHGKVVVGTRRKSGR